MFEPVMKAVDVSHYQGEIDWARVKAGGYPAVMIRAGWSLYEGGLSVDVRFHENIRQAQAAGLEVGAYLYSYDHSVRAAKTAAQALSTMLTPYHLTMPVAFDMEYEPFNLKAGKRLNTEICEAFLTEMEAAGYYSMLYCSVDFLCNHLDSSCLSRYDKWIAQYNAPACSISGCGMWQYTVLGTQGALGRDYFTEGAVDGVATNCDVNAVYRDYPSIIKAKGLNGWAKPGEPEQQPTFPDELAYLRATVHTLQAEKAALKDRVQVTESKIRSACAILQESAG